MEKPPWCLALIGEAFINIIIAQFSYKLKVGSLVTAKALLLAYREGWFFARK